MLIATIGIVFYIKQRGTLSWAVAVFFLINLYILASWWSWWFGGGFSNRAFIDSYGLMAFPLAAFIDQFRRNQVVRGTLIGLLFVLTCFGFFQAQQYRNMAIFWGWMNKEAYWETFLKLRPTNKYWAILYESDVIKARKGIYTTIPIYDQKITRDALIDEVEVRFLTDSMLPRKLQMESETSGKTFDQLLLDSANSYIDKGKATDEYRYLRIQYLKSEMYYFDSWHQDILRQANQEGLSFEDMATKEAVRIFETYSPKYLYPLPE
ncbi:MAG: hypothetical protein JW801_05440 [Bacteroidales bacterium]|nr:hypothetical protein [Bacteroidales bacterium]